jgi:hypothetical protein
MCICDQKKTEQALALLSLLYQLVQEDASWEGNDDLFLETQALQIEILIWRVPEFEDLSGDHSFQEIGQC